MKNLVNEIKKAVNSKCSPNGKAALIVHLKDGQRIKIEKINAGDFYTPIVIAESFPNVAKAELEVY